NWVLSILIVAVMVSYVGMVYGPIGAFLAEYFPARIRYTSVSVPYHIGNGWGGGLVPVITTAAYLKAGIGAALIYPIAVPSIACAAPSTVPCSFGSAYTDTSPVAAGAKTLLETASMNVHPYSSAEPGRNGTTAIATAMPNVPAMTSVRSPTRRTIFPKKYPCTEAAVTPMI